MGGAEHYTAEQFRALLAEQKPRKNKFNAKRTTLANGATFDSKREAEVYVELALRERAGEIANLRTQPVFILSTDPRVSYRGDFRYFDVATDREHVVDVKGRDTEASRIKRAWVKQRYGIIVEIVK